MILRTVEVQIRDFTEDLGIPKYGNRTWLAQVLITSCTTQQSRVLYSLGFGVWGLGLRGLGFGFRVPKP